MNYMFQNYRPGSRRSRALLNLLDLMKPSYPQSFFTNDHGNVVACLVRKLSHSSLELVQLSIHQVARSSVGEIFIRSGRDKLLKRLEEGEYSYLSVRSVDSSNALSDAERLGH